MHKKKEIEDENYINQANIYIRDPIFIKEKL